jgi:hypothetical protein
MVHPYTGVFLLGSYFWAELFCALNFVSATVACAFVTGIGICDVDL